MLQNQGEYSLGSLQLIEPVESEHSGYAQPNRIVNTFATMAKGNVDEHLRFASENTRHRPPQFDFCRA